MDLSPAEMSVPWWEDEQNWGYPAAWGGSVLGGTKLGCHKERDCAVHGCRRDPFPKITL